jgi:hypothetical protein
LKNGQNKCPKMKTQNTFGKKVLQKSPPPQSLGIEIFVTFPYDKR